MRDNVAANFNRRQSEGQPAEDETRSRDMKGSHPVYPAEELKKDQLYTSGLVEPATPKAVLQGIIWAEIIGRPKCRRQRLR